MEKTKTKTKIENPVTKTTLEPVHVYSGSCFARVTYHTLKHYPYLYTFYKTWTVGRPRYKAS